ncbi:MAG TPA: hypothetical protein VE776_09070 [Actinomycetota bacterium]|jgi:hypothetical protein|nr:hypothetical protein [Actinomycetota bacterium]
MLRADRSRSTCVRLLAAWEIAERVLVPSLAAALSDWVTLVLPSVDFYRSQHDRGRFSNIASKSQIRVGVNIRFGRYRANRTRARIARPALVGLGAGEMGGIDWARRNASD